MKSEIWFVSVAATLLGSLLLSACQPAPTQEVVDTATQVPTTPPTATALAGEAPSVEWSFATQGPIWGTPTVEQGVVYAGSDDHHLYALEATSGKMKWKFETGGIIRSRPAAADGRVFFASDDGYLYALDAQSGEEAWKTDIGNLLDDKTRGTLANDPNPLGWDYRQSSPVLVDGVLYIGSLDGKVYAVAASDGQVRWTYQTGEKVRATAAVDQGIVYIGSWDKNFYALDAGSGEVIWQTPLNGQVQSQAWVEGGIVYCASRKASVVAMDAQSGEIRWEFPYGDNMWVESSPVLANGILYIGSSGSSMVISLELAKGEQQSGYFSSAFHWSSPLVIGETIYIGAASYQKPENGGLYAFTLVNGRIKPGKEYLRSVPAPETKEFMGVLYGVAGSPVTADGLIFYGALDGRLYAVRD